jgi:GNAT superfamily N-acetyltransferase
LRPGRAESVINDWPTWGLHAHRPDAYFIALEDGRLLGYGYLELEDERWSNGFMAVTREARDRGVAGALKRAQIRWAKEEGIATLRTANEVRLHSMRDLNRRCGYAPLYDEIVLRGPLREDLG